MTARGSSSQSILAQGECQLPTHAHSAACQSPTPQAGRCGIWGLPIASLFLPQLLPG